MLMRVPSKTLYDYFKGLNVAADDVDFMGRTPFMVSTLSQPERKEFHPAAQDLLSRNVRFDHPDFKGRTPFLYYYENKNFELANLLLQKGANVCAMDHSGLFALKYALIRRQDSEIRRLHQLGADINQRDKSGRNLLHHAVNMSSATADATFETERCLIELGIDINARDNKGRVPLHYAFVKIQKWSDKSQIDPIETVSSLCGQASLEIEVPDKWHKTPLHYAAQRAASICSLYLINRGANLEA